MNLEVNLIGDESIESHACVMSLKTRSCMQSSPYQRMLFLMHGQFGGIKDHAACLLKSGALHWHLDQVLKEKFDETLPGLVRHQQLSPHGKQSG